jgi:hypothetical protein
MGHTRRICRWQTNPVPEPPLEAAFLGATKSLPKHESRTLQHPRADARISVVGELTNRKRGRVFSYSKYVQELAAGMESRPAG